MVHGKMSISSSPAVQKYPPDKRFVPSIECLILLQGRHLLSRINHFQQDDVVDVVVVVIAVIVVAIDMTTETHIGGILKWVSQLHYVSVLKS